jgi:hypothetical protein
MGVFIVIAIGFTDHFDSKSMARGISDQSFVLRIIFGVEDRAGRQLAFHSESVPAGDLVLLQCLFHVGEGVRRGQFGCPTHRIGPGQHHPSGLEPIARFGGQRGRRQRGVPLGQDHQRRADILAALKQFGKFIRIDERGRGQHQQAIGFQPRRAARTVNLITACFEHLNQTGIAVQPVGGGMGPAIIAVAAKLLARSDQIDEREEHRKAHRH